MVWDNSYGPMRHRLRGARGDRVVRAACPDSSARAATHQTHSGLTRQQIHLMLLHPRARPRIERNSQARFTLPGPAVLYLAVLSIVVLLERSDSQPNTLRFFVPALLIGLIVGSPWALLLPVAGVAVMTALGHPPAGEDQSEVAALIGAGAGVAMRAGQAAMPWRPYVGRRQKRARRRSRKST